MASESKHPEGRLRVLIGAAGQLAVTLAVYLASDESSCTTGQIHLADGGFAR